MNIVIYSRKSKISDKGESIENQINLCKEYATLHFEQCEFTIFQDEGFSGGNTNRPQFQAMVKGIKKGLYDVLICYRLDRISRNVSDFSSTLELLTNHHVGFVSVKEQFDTTTPMGRAMIHISSVFAQLERETIAERIRDNLLELSKTGRWLGGTAPLGYIAVRKDYMSGDKVKHYTVLEIDPYGKDIVTLIFNKYLELGSISQVETYLMQKNLKTLNGKYFQSNTIRCILMNPTYCAIDDNSYKYFKSIGVVMNELERNDGTAFMPYNRHKSGKYNMKNNPEEWILAVGSHEPIITSEQWISVQHQIKNNSDTAIPKGTGAPALLTGLIYCKNCGSVMKVTNQIVLADGTISYTYRCSNKLISRGKVCNINNISKGYVLDEIVINRIKDMVNNKKELIDTIKQHHKSLSSAQDELNLNINQLENKIKDNEKSIQSLIKKLARFDDTQMEKYIQDEVNALHVEISELTNQLNAARELTKSKDFDIANIDTIFSSIKRFCNEVDKSTKHEKRQLIREVVKSISWDGINIDISFFISNTLSSTTCNFEHGSKISSS